MKRRIALLLAASAVATTFALGAGAAPASADTDLCAGTGSANLSASLFYPGGAPVTASFSFGFTVGACHAKPEGLFAAGTVTGWCGLSVGAGATHNGHRFHWLGVGGELILTGEVTGVVNAVPNALANQFCSTGANSFLVQGAVAKTHCANKTKSNTDIPTPWGTITNTTKDC